MSNSFTAAPGELSYDDRGDGPRPNTTCPDCGRRYWKGRDDSGGELCDACADVAWMAEQDRRARRMSARVEAAVQAAKGVA